MYYKVRAKCGHVGRNHYIEKQFYVEASSGKEAALKVRYFPRVKHHHKDAILYVKQISQNEFCEGVEINKDDYYFKVTNSTEQRLFGAAKPEDIKRENQLTVFRKKRNVDYAMKRRKILERQCDKMIEEAIYG
ncbi:MAG: hypothetical protein J1G02_05695 [Clostridiales bacterium]|nr:hypothetical protein [Clostridiales bacterium]